MKKQRAIATIDKDISAIRRRLQQLEHIDPMSAESWQAAWDRHPELRDRDSTLYLERGMAQLALAYAEVKSKINKPRFPGWRHLTHVQRRNERMHAMFERARILRGDAT